MSGTENVDVALNTDRHDRGAMVDAFCASTSIPRENVEHIDRYIDRFVNRTDIDFVTATSRAISMYFDDDHFNDYTNDARNEHLLPDAVRRLEASRALRQEQDDAFAEASRLDAERDEQCRHNEENERKATMDERKAEKSLRDLIQKKRKRVGEWDRKKKDGGGRIAVRLPDGHRFARAFSRHDTVDRVFDALDVHLADLYGEAYFNAEERQRDGVPGAGSYEMILQRSLRGGDKEKDAVLSPDSKTKISNVPVPWDTVLFTRSL